MKQKAASYLLKEILPVIQIRYIESICKKKIYQSMNTMHLPVQPSFPVLINLVSILYALKYGAFQ